MAVYITPSPVIGYELNPARGYFSVIVPEATTNLVPNPSFELTTTGWLDLSAGALARTSDHQVAGAYSLQYTPDANTQAGVYHAFTTLEVNTAHTFSAYVKGAVGVPMELYFYDNTNSTILARVKFRGDGRWHRYHVTGQTSNGASHWIVVRKDQSASTSPFYIDGVQLEQKSYVTTYCDGDMVGLVPGQTAFYWTGTRHLSRSVRIADTTVGGRVKRLDDIGLKISSYLGLGMPSITNVSIPLALIGGANYQRTVPQSRTFTLVGDLFGAGQQELQRVRRDLINVFKPFRVSQPILLRYQAFNCGDEIGEELEIPCVYVAGLEGITDNNYQERVSVQLQAFDPFFRKVVETAETSVDLIVNVADSDYISKRDPSGEFLWFRIGEGLDNAVRTLAWGPNGRLYAGGDFINADNGSPVAVNYIANYNFDTDIWDDLDGGVNGVVRAMAFDALGNLYVGGSFLAAGFAATTVNCVAVWDGSAWAAMGGTPGVNNVPVYAVVVGPDGNVYIGGNFTEAGGGAANYVAMWDGAAWSALGTGMNAEVRALAFGPDGNLYAGGAFTTADGSSANYVAKWDGSAWSALGAGTNGVVYALAFGLDGTLYVGGGFGQAGGNNIGGKIARWDGSAWHSLGGGLAGGDTFSLAIEPKSGNLYVGGTFTSYKTKLSGTAISLLDSFIGWNGVAWFHPDVNFPTSAASVFAMVGRNDGSFTVGYNTTGNAVMSPLIMATNNGNADAYPRIVITGEGEVYRIENTTTGDAIYFTDFSLLEGETVTIDLAPGRKTVTSTQRGNLLGKIAPGSHLSTWRLVPGDNILVIHLPDATANVSVIWRDAYWDVEAGIL